MKKKKNIKANKTKQITPKKAKKTEKIQAKKKVKTTAKKSITVPEKTENRGRPPKVFVYQKPQIKRDGPGRPKKSEKVQLPEIPEKTENKVKDLIILILFIISFMVFGFSVYVSINKKNEINTVEANTIPSSGESVKLVVEDEKSLVLGKIYSAWEQKNFEELYTNIDLSLKKSTTFKTFFSTSRLERFINNIDNQKIKLTIESIETSNIKYTISYTINQTPYTEQREADFIQRNDQRKISKIMCTSSGCSKGPFFNPKKYF